MNTKERHETIESARKKIENAQVRSGPVNGLKRSYCAKSRSQYGHVHVPKTKETLYLYLHKKIMKNEIFIKFLIKN